MRYRPPSPRQRPARAHGPLFAGILTGGAGQRLGRPKETLRLGETLLVARLAETLEELTAETFLLGRGVAGSGLPVILDPPGLEGPLAAMVAAFRFAPAATWVFVPCDLPGLRPAGVRWLIDQRAPGRAAVLPTVAGRPQPLPALYEPAAARLLEALVSPGGGGPRLLASHPLVATPEPPGGIAPSWQDVDTPEELARWRGLE